MGSITASALKKIWGWEASIGRVRLGLWNRVIIDDFLLKDQQDSTLLHASRLAAKIDLLPLMQGRISIANVQLFGTEIHTYQNNPGEKPNFQFLIDTFKSDKQAGGGGTKLHIGSILLRRVSIVWHKHWKPRKGDGSFDTAHLHFSDIAVTAQLKTLAPDSINLSVKRLSFTEESGLTLKNLSFDLKAGSQGGVLEDFTLQLPRSVLSIPSAQFTWPHFPKKGDGKEWLTGVSVMAYPSLTLMPADLSPLASWARHDETTIDMTSTVLFSEACLNIPSIRLSDDKSFELLARAFVYDIIGSPEYSIELERLRTNRMLLEHHAPRTASALQGAMPILTRMDTIDISGNLRIKEQEQRGALMLKNKYGNLDIKVLAHEWNDIQASIASNGLELDRILRGSTSTEEMPDSPYSGTQGLGRVAFNIDAQGQLRDQRGKPDMDVQLSLPVLQWQGKEYNDITAHAIYRGDMAEASLNAQDCGGKINSHATWRRDKLQHLVAHIDVDKIPLERLGLGDRYSGTLLSVDTDINLRGNNIDDIAGSVEVHNFLMEDTTDLPNPHIDSLVIYTNIDRNGQRTLSVTSEPLNLTANGDFRFTTLATTLSNTLHSKLPQLVPHQSSPSKADSIRFALSIQDTTLLRRIALVDISIPQVATIEGHLCGHDSMSIQGIVPELRIENELLLGTKVHAYGLPHSLTAQISLERRHRKGFVSMGMSADAHDNRLRLIASLNNNRTPNISGTLDVTTTFQRSDDGKLGIRAWIAPTTCTISDTIWNVHPSAITWDGQTADIRGFRVNQSPRRGIYINGRASANSTDTLAVQLNEINVEYILDLVNFNAVEFRGLVSGQAHATGLFSSPNASANLTVEGFSFNQAPLGTLQAQANWGSTPHFLALDATISDPANQHHSHIEGGFHLGSKERPNGLDLMVKTQRFNLAFMNTYAEDFLEDFQGRASGHCRIYGPFKAIDLQGDLNIDYAHFGMPMLGTSYHLKNDSVHVRPREISIDALLRDKYAPSQPTPFALPSPHTAVTHASLKHKHFKGMTYDFKVKANNFLGYDFKDFGEESFYATCFVSGNISVEGQKGRLYVDVNATPEKGTVFTYNVSTPDALTNAQFISIGTIENDTTLTNDLKLTPTTNTATTTTSSDVYLDFNLPITRDTKVRLLMDRESGDMIELNGGGRIMAKYYNKGRFTILGTYRVEGGTYSLTIQDIIRKDFKFQPGGTIVFGGNAMKADLNLRAVYSVNSVSLDDLSTTSLGFSKTRVDCIMNLTGHPEQPAITFDFDLPNASEDERQMVRSIVSTEEERNMQAVYLLGLGRFYNFNADGATQSSAAMNSLVSSTLSSHLNNLITTAVGSSKWSVNTFLQTTEDGWRNMDVEGQLSGSLFDDRLLLTGNFGYREKNYTQRNLITDVSVEYLLTPSGTLSLKAYNQANDRYFVPSSLNTQGIGLQYKKDFNRLTDLFPWLKREKD